jgi:integrase
MVQTNVAETFDRSLLRERRAPIRAPADAVVQLGVDTAKAAGDGILAALIRFLRATGMRAGEALRARWEDIEGDGLTIYETKNGRARTIAVSPAVLPAGKRDGSLFPGVAADTGALASRWQWIRRTMPKESRFRLHDLRHAYAIAEIRAGRDIYDLSHHLGHSSVKVTEIYLGYAAGGQRANSRTQVAQRVTHAAPKKRYRKESVTSLES